MSKCIDADALDEIIQNAIVEVTKITENNYGKITIGQVMVMNDMKNIISQKACKMPAVDVEPVRHGHWIRETDGGTRCSCCMETVKEDSSGVKIPVDLSDMAYCPKCGAKMDGGSEE